MGKNGVKGLMSHNWRIQPTVKPRELEDVYDLGIHVMSEEEIEHAKRFPFVVQIRNESGDNVFVLRQRVPRRYFRKSNDNMIELGETARKRDRYCGAANFKISKHRLSDTEKTDIIALYTQSKLSTEAIARQLKCSASSVLKWLHKAGVTMRHRQYKTLSSQTRAEIAQAMTERGRTPCRVIASRYGVSMAVAYRAQYEQQLGQYA